jgi:phosphatidylglycerol---prolipoprotein diacylglyceryl transferase
MQFPPIAFYIPFINAPVRWYGIIIVLSVIIGGAYAAYEFRRKGSNPDIIWESLFWILLFGLLGTRLWFVAADILSGRTFYLDNPTQILNIPAGGLNIFGGIAVGILVCYIYTKYAGISFLFFMDAVGPAVLLAQAFGRLANFVNQELYGPPTTLPWGVTIVESQRVGPWRDMALYPPETRFHPTFFYEMVWNLLAFALLLYIGHRYYRHLKQGTLFSGYIMLHGLGRFWVESFRPDQPLFPGANFSISRLLAALMFLLGLSLFFWLRRHGQAAAATGGKVKWAGTPAKAVKKR